MACCSAGFPKRRVHAGLPRKTAHCSLRWGSTWMRGAPPPDSDALEAADGPMPQQRSLCESQRLASAQAPQVAGMASGELIALTIGMAQDVDRMRKNETIYSEIEFIEIGDDIFAGDEVCIISVHLLTSSRAK